MLAGSERAHRRDEKEKMPHAHGLSTPPPAASLAQARAINAEEMGEPNTVARPRVSYSAWFRVGLGVAGLVVLVLLVRNVGAERVLDTLGGALPWLPLLGAIEACRIVCESASSYIAFGPLAARIPKATLLRAHVLGHSIANIAPAPTVVNESIKATLLTPYTGAGPAASVGVINQAAVLISAGLFSIPCGVCILALGGASMWFWACAVHAVVLVASGVVVQAVSRAGAPRRWVVRKFPKLAPRIEAFHAHAMGTDLFALKPTTALMIGRCLQTLQYAIAAFAVGIDATALRAMASEGVNLVASAVFVLVPGGFGTTDGAFTLASDLLHTTEAKATSLALLIRCTQFVWILIASAVALSGPRRRA